MLPSNAEFMVCDQVGLCFRHSGTQTLKEHMTEQCLAAQINGLAWASSSTHLTMITSTTTHISWLLSMMEHGCMTT